MTEFELEGTIRSRFGPVSNFQVFVRGYEWLIRSTPSGPFGYSPCFWEAGSTNNSEVVQPIRYDLRTNRWTTVKELYDLYEKQQIMMHPELGFAKPLPKAIPLREPFTIRRALLGTACLTLFVLILFKGA